MLWVEGCFVWGEMVACVARHMYVCSASATVCTVCCVNSLLAAKVVYQYSITVYDKIGSRGFAKCPLDAPTRAPE